MSLFTDIFLTIKRLITPGKKINKKRKVIKNRKNAKIKLKNKTIRIQKFPVKTKKTFTDKSKKKTSLKRPTSNKPSSLRDINNKKRILTKPKVKTKKTIPKAKLGRNPLIITTKSPLIGEVTHYFSKINVIVLRVDGHPINIGDKINIKGSSTDYIQKVSSLQIESIDVKSAKKGQLVGLKVLKPTQIGDKVYKLS